MRRSLWIALGLGFGLVLLAGCQQKTATTIIQPSGKPATGRTAHPTAPGAKTTPAPPANSGPNLANPATGRQSSFAAWWNSLTPEERAHFNQLPPEERRKKIREVVGQ